MKPLQLRQASPSRADQVTTRRPARSSPQKRSARRHDGLADASQTRSSPPYRPTASSTSRPVKLRRLHRQHLGSIKRKGCLILKAHSECARLTLAYHHEDTLDESSGIARRENTVFAFSPLPSTPTSQAPRRVVPARKGPASSRQFHAQTGAPATPRRDPRPPATSHRPLERGRG